MWILLLAGRRLEQRNPIHFFVDGPFVSESVLMLIYYYIVLALDKNYIYFFLSNQFF